MTSEIIQADSLNTAGQLANHIAGAGVFTDYQARRAERTCRRQRNDLALFTQYLQELKQSPGDFYNDPRAWCFITWGLVSGFVRWLLKAGYSVGSVNVALSTVKTYATLAAQAGALDSGELTMLQTVKGYKRSEAKHIDQLRESTRRTQRSDGTRAHKKTEPVFLAPGQVAALKDQPNTPQGRRDRLLLCLMLDHGLRVGEVAALTIGNFDLQAGELIFYRPKVNLTQTHRLTADTWAAARSYLVNDAPAIGVIWRASRKGKAGKLTHQGMTARAITQRVTDLGAALGIKGLSAHDLRHTWATLAARSGTPIERLQDAGGWSSLAMPGRYVEAAKIANQGVKLD